MQYELIHLAAILKCQCFSANTIRRLLAHFGSAHEIWSATKKGLILAKCKLDSANNFLAKRQTIDLHQIQHDLSTENVQVIPDNDSRYPAKLRQIFDPPIILFVRGNVDILNYPQSLSVVGSRAITRYGEAATQIICRPLARAGICLVSGLAFGIDAAAHQSALDESGPTVAVLAGGVDRASVGPRENAWLAEKIVDSSGTLVSEWPPGTISYKGNFPLRNRIISGLSTGLIVVEAAEKSGALITAKQALDQGRDVWAVPGPINQSMSSGTNQLLANGAMPALSAEVILQYYGCENQTQNRPDKQLSANETLITNNLAKQTLNIDEIVDLTGLTPTAAMATLTSMEISGLIKRQGNTFRLNIDNRP